MLSAVPAPLSSRHGIRATVRRVLGRLALRLAYRLILAAALVSRPRTRGAKAALEDGEGRLLFVRHTYGDRRAWELPGGGLKRGETPLDAVRREAREEVGADVGEWRELGQVQGEWHGRSDTVWVFAAPWPGGPPVLDDLELADFAWFSPQALPERISPVTRAALGARAGAAPPGPSGAPRA